MTQAVAAIIAKDGDWFASQTPAGDVHAPPSPATRPIVGMHVLFFRWVIQPAIEVGMIVKREVAVASIATRPNPIRKKGTIKVPPPIPKRPEKVPIPIPQSAEIMKDSISLLKEKFYLDSLFSFIAFRNSSLKPRIPSFVS